MAAVAAVLVVPVSQAHYLMGGDPLLLSFIVVIIGGLGSLRGTLVAALVIGGVAGVLCQEMVLLVKNRLHIDDTLDVFAVHGVGGIFGTVMVAVLGAGTWAAQLGGLAVVGLWTTAASWALIKLCALVLPLRVDLETEVNGLDLSVHGERAYELNS